MSNESRWQPRNTSSYDDQWKKLAASGQNPHGEADFVTRFDPQSVLDAGCGTGRVAIELAARGIGVHGVDLDASMIATARTKAPQLTWTHADLAGLELRVEDGGPATFDLVVLAGNVMIFVAEGTEQRVLERMAAHLRPGGLLVAGFQLNRGLSATAYKGLASNAGLTSVERWSTWNADPATPGDTYGVFVHRQPMPTD